MTTTSIDIKVRFQPYDCVPNYERWEAFEEELLGHGGRSDGAAWSFADVFRGLDGGGAAGTPIATLGGSLAERRKAGTLRRKRLKESHTFLLAQPSVQ